MAAVLRGIAAAVLLGLCGGAQAQQPFTVPPQVHLTLGVDEAKLIVETLGQIGCQNVQQLMLCQNAAVVLRSIQSQVRDQQK